MTVADGVQHPIVAEGDVGMFKNVKIAPGLKTDMISVSKLCDDGNKILLTKDGA